jgi:hypothetical protein
MRSAVKVRVEDVRPSEILTNDTNLGDLETYALWPARGTKELPTVPRRAPGVELTLRVTVPEGEDGEKEAVRRAIVA